MKTFARSIPLIVLLSGAPLVSAQGSDETYDRADDLIARAIAFYGEGNPGSAIKDLKEALGLVRGLDSNPAAFLTAQANQTWGAILDAQGKRGEARKKFVAACDSYQKLPVDQFYDDEYFIFLMTWVDFLEQEKLYKEGLVHLGHAADHFRSTATGRGKTDPAAHHRLAVTVLYLGQLEVVEGHLTQAEQHFDAAFEGLARSAELFELGNVNPATWRQRHETMKAGVHYWSANLTNRQGAKKEAREHVESALRLLNGKSGEQARELKARCERLRKAI